MKSRRTFPTGVARWSWAALCLVCISFRAFSAEDAETNAPAAAAPAAATNAPEASAQEAAGTNAPEAAVAEPLTPQQMFEGGDKTYNNWVEFSAGGFITSGNRAQFEQQHRSNDGAFGGIEDLHYKADLGKGTTLTLDGHALFDNKDYKLSLNLTKENVGYVRFSINQFRTWYNGDGGFYPPSGLNYSLSDDALALDRGEISFEAGLRMENKPQVTFKYTHRTRDGDKSSTGWGFTHPSRLPGAAVRALSPTLYDIDEHSDTFQIDVTHHIKLTDLGIGLSYETGALDDARLIDQWASEPIQQKVTTREGTSYDLFNIHAFTETWFNSNLMLSSGYSFSDLDNNFSGSRIYGNDFDVSYVPSAQNGFGYVGLGGGSRLHEYVMDLNLLTVPLRHLTITPSIRVQKEDTDADFAGFETLGVNSAQPFAGSSERGILDVRERLDLRYNAITNWVLFGRGEWTEGDGNLSENGGLGPVGGFGLSPVLRETDDSRFFQKYSAGARWYPARSVTLSAGGYYKLNDYDYNHLLDNTPNFSGNRYPAYLVMQDFETYDGNVGLTLRPLKNITLISRYEYQLSTIHTQPDPISGLADIQTSDMTSHILAQDVTWTPWSRLYLQAGFNYVLSETRTPASDVTQAILNAQNNYWTLNFSSGFVVDDKTDLNLGYFYYRADDYQDFSASGLPLGAGAEQHGITATLVRRITRNLRLTLRYGFSHYTDELYGGHRDFDAHLVYSSLQYRF